MPEETTQAAADGSGAASAAPKFDMNDPAVQEYIQKSIDDGLKASKARIDEFRESNVKARKEVDQWNSLGVGFDEAQEIVTAIKASKEAQMIAKGQLDEVVTLRTEPIRKDFERQLAQRDKDLEELSQKNNSLQKANYDLWVGNQLALAASAIQDLYPGAVGFLMDRARSIWIADGENGQITPYMPGTNGIVWKGKDGKTDITFKEWIETFRDSQESFIFKSASGMPARGGNAGGTHKPWDNLTGEAKLQAWRESQGIR